MTLLICLILGQARGEYLIRINWRHLRHLRGACELGIGRGHHLRPAQGGAGVAVSGPQQIERLSQAFEELAVGIANPHTYFLQNGGMHKIDDAQIAFKRASDPFSLMNPGKIAGFDEIDGAPGGAAHIKASGWAY